MTVLLLCLMAYQVTGEAAHEYIGMCMTFLVIVHQILNRKWDGALFKGRYNLYRTIATAVNVLLILSFILTAFCGMSMSGYAVPFLYGMAKVSFVRVTHLALSHWAFVLMGIHLGLRVPVMTAGMKLREKQKLIFASVFGVLAGIGLFLFLRNNMTDYMFFRVAFAFLDYEKPGALVFFENVLMLGFWVYAGAMTASFCQKRAAKNDPAKNPLHPVLFLMGSVILGLILNTVFPNPNAQGFGSNDWSASQPTAEETPSAAPAADGGNSSGSSSWK